MKTPSILKTKVLPHGEMADYKPRWYEKYLRKVTITDVEIVVLKANSSKTRALIPTSRVLNTVELLEDILLYLSYKDLNCVYYTCKGFHRVIDNSSRLSKVLFMQPDDADTAFKYHLPVKNLLPIKIFSTLSYVDPSLKIVCHLTTHSLESLCKQPRIQVLDRFITQPPLRSVDLWIDTHCPATKEFAIMVKDACVTNDHGITLADLVRGIKSLTGYWIDEREQRPFWIMTVDVKPRQSVETAI